MHKTTNLRNNTNIIRQFTHNLDQSVDIPIAIEEATSNTLVKEVANYVMFQISVLNTDVIRTIHCVLVLCDHTGADYLH